MRIAIPYPYIHVITYIYVFGLKKFSHRMDQILIVQNPKNVFFYICIKMIKIIILNIFSVEVNKFVTCSEDDEIILEALNVVKNNYYFIVILNIYFIILKSSY